MLIQNESEVIKKKMSAHNGAGEIVMKFFHTDNQNFLEKLKNDDLKNPSNNTLWNFFALAELPIGADVGLHRHVGNDEIYYILDGFAEIEIDGEKSKIKKGDVVLTKSGSSHRIKNVTKKLKFIALEVLIDGYRKK